MPQGPARTADTDEELAMQRRISAALMDEWLHSLTPAQRRAMAALRLIGRGAVRVRCGPGGGVRGRVASEDGGEEYEVEFEGGVIYPEILRRYGLHPDTMEAEVAEIIEARRKAKLGAWEPLPEVQD